MNVYLEKINLMGSNCTNRGDVNGKPFALLPELCTVFLIEYSQVTVYHNWEQCSLINRLHCHWCICDQQKITDMTKIVNRDYTKLFFVKLSLSPKSFCHITTTAAPITIIMMDIKPKRVSLHFSSVLSSSKRKIQNHFMGRSIR
jgi:hypothetical protein